MESHTEMEWRHLSERDRIETAVLLVSWAIALVFGLGLVWTLWAIVGIPFPIICLIGSLSFFYWINRVIFDQFSSVSNWMIKKILPRQKRELEEWNQNAAKSKNCAPIKLNEDDVIE